MRRLGLLILLAISMLFSACDDIQSPTSDQKEQAATRRLTEQATQQVGMPGVTRFTEKKIVAKLYELRDQNVSTYTYVPDMNGRLFHLCDSLGYGLPYGVQFSNPEQMVNGNSEWNPRYLLPQAEPNGLFMPPSAEGTWVICGTDAGKITPVYVEPRVIVSPFKLNSVGEYMAKP